jgi:AAA domain
MPSLSSHQSREFTKLLITGDSKAGKTGALASLVAAGYKLRILDYDNGLDILGQVVRQTCPELIDNVESRTLRDKWKMTQAGPVIDGTPTAFITGIKMLDLWKYKEGEHEIDLGVPSKWGPECIFVLDSLTFFSDAAFAYREVMTPKSKSGGVYDRRAIYKDAQDVVESTLAMLTGKSFGTNVIVISHVDYQDNPDGTRKGYPVSVGKKLSPKVPAYFNNYFRFVTKGGKHKIEAHSTTMFDLANARPFDMPKEFDVGDGLARIFELLRK